MLNRLSSKFISDIQLKINLGGKLCNKPSMKIVFMKGHFIGYNEFFARLNLL